MCVACVTVGTTTPPPPPPFQSSPQRPVDVRGLSMWTGVALCDQCFFAMAPRPAPRFALAAKSGMNWVRVFGNSPLDAVVPRLAVYIGRRRHVLASFHLACRQGCMSHPRLRNEATKEMCGGGGGGGVTTPANTHKAYNSEGDREPYLESSHKEGG